MTIETEVIADLRIARASYSARMDVCPDHDDEQRAFLEATLDQIDADLARYSA
jgi:hypothetical protein